jgi:hypothetical protein
LWRRGRRLKQLRESYNMSFDILCKSIETRVAKELASAMSSDEKALVLSSSLLEYASTVLKELNALRQNSGEGSPEYLKARNTAVELLSFLALPMIHHSVTFKEGVTAFEAIASTCADEEIRKWLVVYGNQLKMRWNQADLSAHTRDSEAAESLQQGKKGSILWGAIIVTVLLIAVIFLFAPFDLSSAPFLDLDIRHEIEDGFERRTAKNFYLPLDMFSAREQSDLIGELQRRHYKMRCYGSLRPEEKFGKSDDYQCWFIVKAAYDNIPAKKVVLSFDDARLAFVKMEFPESSFSKLQSYLSRRMTRYPVLDSNGYTDNFGKPLIVWQVESGFMTTSAESTEGQPITLLWSSNSQGPQL